MPPRLQPARDQLIAELSRRRLSSASELAQSLGVSVPTVHRLIQEVSDRILTRGKARRARYAARRALRGQHQDCPVYEVNPAGQAQHIGTLACTEPQGTCLSLPEADWPLPEEARDGWWDGLPYPLQDMRPQGYLGRQLARREHLTLAVPANPAEWNDDDALYVLQQRGEDASGSLILGDIAYTRWQEQRQSPPTPLPADGIGPAYLALARQAVAQGVPGSSAAGEFPKFGALRHDPTRPTPHVLVKFSGEEASATVTRWADLLVCEHLALQTLNQLQPMGLRAAHSRVLQHGGRTFLEVERFDRHGLWGRSRLCSLETVQSSFLGDRATDWPALTARLHREGLLSQDHATQAELLWWFGRLIANTDMHLGNLGLIPGPGADGAPQFQLAPAYDMLPMLYAPLAGGEVAPREFSPPWPLPPQRPVWLAACQAARHLWQHAAQDLRISAGFRALCDQNDQRLAQWAQEV